MGMATRSFTVSRLMEHFLGLYGRRNRLFFQSFHDRTDRLLLAAGELQNMLRHEDSEEIKRELANLVAWLFCVINYFKGLPFLRALHVKYPLDHCGYCHKSLCQCSEKRLPANFQSRKLEDEELERINRVTVRGYQAHLKVIYDERNRQNGLENAVNRLFKEIGEVVMTTVGKDKGKV